MGGVVSGGLGGTRTLLGFGFDDVNIAASVTNQAMSGLGASSEGDFVPFPLSVVGIAARGNADVTAGSITFEAMLDGVGTGLTCVIDTTNPRQKGTTQAAGLDAAANGGRIHCRYTTNAGFLPTGSTEYEVYVYVVADMTGL
jgi:hypothetical protein